jgi:tetratricopeptide (TPR) repeat protein
VKSADRRGDAGRVVPLSRSWAAPFVFILMDSYSVRSSIMRPFTPGRAASASLLGIVLTAVLGCGQSDRPEANPPEPEAKTPATPGAKKPAEPIDALALHFQGVGLMEQYEYARAAAAFRQVHEHEPDSIPASINLAIALLNMTGEQVEAARKTGGDGAEMGNFEEALHLLANVLEREPDNLHAHFCTGIILEQQGDLAAAHEHFRRVTELDPKDAIAWYWSASTLTDPDNPLVTTSPKLAREQAALYEKALELDPYLTQAIYRLAFVSRLTGNPDRQRQLLARWENINPDRQKPVPGPGNTAAKVYGEMGRYAMIISPMPRQPAGEASSVTPKFEPSQPLKVKMAEGDRWAGAGDFQGDRAVLGRARARFGAAVSTFDANGDGKPDLYLPAAVVGAKGPRDALLINKGDGTFEDASAAFGLPADLVSLGAAAADFDADRHVDLFLTGVGKNRLLRNKDGKSFEDLTASLKGPGPAALSLMARWMDLDQDGDLDLYVVNYCAAEHAARAFLPDAPPPPGVPNTVFRNDGQPEAIPGAPAPAWAPLAVAWENVKSKSGLSLALVPWTGMEPLLGGEAPHTGIAALDLEGDRDLDLVLTADGLPPVAVLNDRLGNFHETTMKDVTSLDAVSGLLVTDLDRDGRADLAAPSTGGRLVALRNTTERAKADEIKITWEPFPVNADRWHEAAAGDLDLDGTPDLVGLAASASKDGAEQGMRPAWARNEGKRLSAREWPVTLETPGVVGFTLADLAGDPLPDLLVVRSGEAPALARNLGNGHHWLALQLGGHWRVKPELMRTNSHAIGTRVVVEGQGLGITYDHTTPESGLAQSIGPVVLGLGPREAADLVHLRWPDGVMQCELNVASNQKMILSENNRKTGSCPVLFTWDGERFVCLGDFLGGGGMGYLVAPGVYSQPDRDEAVAIAADQLRAEQGRFLVSVTEPMDEVAYLDHLRLDVVDRPPGVTVAPDERFAPSGPRPTGELLAWREAIAAGRATDLEGRDMTGVLRHWDRRTVDTFRKREGWVGYAEEHGIVLDFGDRLARFGRDDRLVLCLAGWVEYPYSQTNYAAATAGVTLSPPAIERLREDGTWENIEPHAGYPAGLPRMTTLDLSGKLAGDRCVLRIKTNMECYYDQAFIAVRDRQAERALRVTSLPVGAAVLGPRGYTREVSPDGRLPLLYAYDYVDPAPLARMAGKLTRFGEVAGLLQQDDDRFCVVGPGDEVRIEFDARSLPALPSGWTRSYVLRSYGYCKDADPFTATSDTVEPLPWKGMPAFPFAPGVERPEDPGHERYLREFQTRPAGG